jgi:exosortase A
MQSDNTFAKDNNQNEAINLSFTENKAFYISSFAILCLWVLFCWRGLSSVVHIWYGNEIFNHGFFIVPGSFYLIYLKRKTLFAQPMKTTPAAFILIIPAMLLYVIGIAGDIQLFLHTSTFILLPAVIWLMIGSSAAKIILFPLVFMLFSIPVGEQLIPYLQEVAADGSVALLRLTGVPLFRSGLYIEIPQGRFLVAEACSGVSFFIASFVIGSLYAYLNLVSTKRRLAFVTISLLFPVLANIVRVYGIILIAYWTDMEHAAGADHLIYGWFFFAFVIVCLLGIGELIRDNKVKSSDRPNDMIQKPTVSAVTVSAYFSAMLIGYFVYTNVENHTAIDSTSMVDLSTFDDNSCAPFVKFPVLDGPHFEEQITLQGTQCRASLYVAFFDEVRGELASYQNRDFDPSLFSLEASSSIDLDGNDLLLSAVVSPTGDQLFIYKWYVIDSKVFSSQEKVKIYQVINKLLSKPYRGHIWLVATVYQTPDSKTKLKELVRFSITESK